MKNILHRILCALKMMVFGFNNTDLLTEQALDVTGKLLKFIFEVAEKDKPFTTHLHIGEKRIVSFWAYPGLSKNPVDRITELLKEIDELKLIINKKMDSCDRGGLNG